MMNTIHELNDTEINAVSGGASLVDTIFPDGALKDSLQKIGGDVLLDSVDLIDHLAINIFGVGLNKG